MSVEDVRDALTAAGFPHATIRVARDDDLAPPSSVLFGVSVGDACLVAYVWVRLTWQIVGRLPDGACLRP